MLSQLCSFLPQRQQSGACVFKRAHCTRPPTAFTVRRRTCQTERVGTDHGEEGQGHSSEYQVGQPEQRLGSRTRTT